MHFHAYKADQVILWWSENHPQIEFCWLDSEVILHTSQKTGDRYDDDETANSFRPLGNTGPLCALASNV